MPRIRTHDTSTATLDRPQPVAAPVEPPAPRTAAPIRTAAPAPLPVAADVIARRTAELDAAEQLFRRQVSGDALTPDENEFLRHLWPVAADLHRELSRVARYRKHQQQAGSAADRADAARLAAQTAARLAEESPAIVAKIADLQAALQNLETAARDAAAAHDRRSQAVDALRDPIHLGEPHHSRFEAARQRWERDYGRPSRELRHQAEGFRQRAQLDPGQDRDAIAMYCQASKDPRVAGIVHLRFLQTPPDALIRPEDRPRDQRFVTVNSVLWQEHAAELLQRADAAEQEAARLEKAGQALKAELDAMLQSLVPC